MMKTNRAPRTISHQTLLEIKNALPPAAFRKTPSRLVVVALHGVVIIFSFHLAAVMSHWFWALAAIFISAHSLLCIGFIAHDLSHGSILPHGKIRNLAEIFIWGINLMSRTIWRKIHNQTHHVHYGTMNDPDRQFVESERSFLSWAYSFLFLPNENALVGNPLIVLQLFFYNGRNLIAAFCPGTIKPPFVPAKPAYTGRDKIKILLELLVAGTIQITLFAATNFNFRLYLVLAVGAYAATSGLSMFYIFTNHALTPVRDEPSPLEGCTSVIVPGWCDALHSHFSYHTEHHLYPGLNSSFYPHVSRLLAKKFPDEYQRLPIFQAWKLLWKRPMFDKTSTQGT